MNQTANNTTSTATPAAQWRERGEADPHGDRYNCLREQTLGGHMPDDELANHVYMDGLGEPDILPGFPAREFGREARLTMAKDRIRWLSRQLVAALAPTAKPARPFSTYPEDHEKMLRLCTAVLESAVDADKSARAASELADLVKAIFEDEQAAGGKRRDDEQQRCRNGEMHPARDQVAVVEGPDIFRPTHKHLKSGGLYQTLDVVTDATNATNGQKLVLYRNAEDRHFVRLQAEFNDGRFEHIAAAALRQASEASR